MRSCSQFHLERGSLLPGSAPECRRWIFLDQPRPWPPKIEKLAVVEACAPDLRRLGAKMLFSHSGEGGVRAIEPSRGGRFGSVEEALAFFESDSMLEQPELMAVCTHGSRDTCCGRLGPGVAAALARSGVEVLECSHPGGHRFAPTTLTFPEFRCYGHLTATQVPAFLERQRAGRFQPEHYRGALHLGRTAQAAEAAVWAHTGRAPRFSRAVWDQISLVHLETDLGVFVVRLEQVSFQGPASCGEEDDEMRELKVLSVEQTGPPVLQWRV